jgi:hypothetical protein
MRLQELSEADFALLDRCTDGMMARLVERFQDRVQLTVQTHHDGLPQGEMKLFITVDGEQERAVARLGGSLILLGWDIYLRDLTQSARVRCQRAQRALDQIAALGKDQQANPAVEQCPLQHWTDQDLAATRTLH